MRTLTLFKRFFRFGIHIIIGKIEGYNFWLPNACNKKISICVIVEEISMNV